MFFRRRRPPGTVVNGVPIATSWTSDLVKGLLAHQREDPREGTASHFVNVIVQAVRAEVSSGDDDREVYGFCAVGRWAIPARITLAAVGEAQHARSREWARGFLAEEFGVTEASGDREIHGAIYWAGRPSDAGDDEAKRPALDGSLTLSVAAHRALVEELRAALRPGTRPPRLSMRFHQKGRLSPEGLLPSLQGSAALHFNVSRYWLTTYAIHNAAAARENRFFRAAWQDDTW